MLKFSVLEVEYLQNEENIKREKNERFEGKQNSRTKENKILVCLESE